MADLSRLGAAGTPEPTSDLPPARPCGDTGPGEHSPHYWHTAGQRYFCPGLRHREAMALVQVQPPRSCQRRANAEPHPPHGWHPDGPDAPRVWCAGVRSVAGLAERLCFTSTPHPAHGWAGAPPYSACDPQEAPASREYRCPGIPVTSTFGNPQPLAAAFREVPEAERVTASHAWQGASNPLDDLIAYQAAGYPGLSSPREPEVDPAAYVADLLLGTWQADSGGSPLAPLDDMRRAAELLARRPVVMVRTQLGAERVRALLGTETLGIQLVIDENVPEGKALIIDAGRLAERLEEWAQAPTYRTGPGPDVRGATAIIVTGL